MPNKRVIIANPDEPRAGDFAYEFYNKSHPVFGQPKMVARMRRELRGLRGKTVTVTLNGAHKSEDGVTRRFTAKITRKINRYGDMFGAGSAFASALHSVREKYSDEVLVIYSITIEEV